MPNEPELLATDSFPHIIVTITRVKNGKSETLSGLNGIEVARAAGKYEKDVKISEDGKVGVRTVNANSRSGTVNLVLAHHSPSIAFLSELDAADPKDDLVAIDITDTMNKKSWKAGVAWLCEFATANLKKTKEDRTFAFASTFLKMDAQG